VAPHFFGQHDSPSNLAKVPVPSPGLGPGVFTTARSREDETRNAEMLVKTQSEILDGQSSYLFSNEPFKKRPGMTIEDFGLHSDDHFTVFSPTLWDRLGLVGLGHGGLLIGWDRWDWDRCVFRLGGTEWDWDRGVFRLGGTRWDWDRSLFDLSLSQWDRFGTGSVTVPCVCTTWYLIKNRSRKSVFLIKNRSEKKMFLIKNGSEKSVFLIENRPEK